MKLIVRPFTDENDIWCSRNFLRNIFLLNDRLERSWHVARLDYLCWHMITTCDMIPPLEKISTLWQTPNGDIVAFLHPICHDEVRLHIHPDFRTPELEEEIVAYAEDHLSDKGPRSDHILYLHATAVNFDDFFGQAPSKDVGHGLIGVVPVKSAPDIDKDQVPVMQLPVTTPEQRDGG